MANIFTRKALNEIMSNEALTPEQRTEQVFGLYGRALDDGYIAKTAAQQAQQTALDNAKAEWEKGIKAPDPKESDVYKALQSQFDSYESSLFVNLSRRKFSCHSDKIIARMPGSPQRIAFQRAELLHKGSVKG